MASWVITDADRDAEGRIRVGAAEASVAPAEPATPDRPSAEQLGAFLPPAPAQRGLPARPRPTRRALALAAAGALVVGATLPLWGGSTAVAPNVAPTAGAAQPTRASTAAAPTPTSSWGSRLARAVVAYAAPGGQALGALEAGRPYTPTARLGIAWTQIEAAGSGRVWVAAAELAPAPDLADLATPTPAPRPVAPEPVVVEQPAAPPPTVCASVAGGGVAVQRCGSGPIEALDAQARAAWRAQFGGQPVQVLTPTARR